MNNEQLKALVRSLIALPDETEWVEFKHNNSEPDMIGEYLSGLANSAALKGQPTGFIIWGVEDGSRIIVGTDFKPRKRKIGNQELESWLVNLLTPRQDLKIYELKLDGAPVVVFEIPAARHTPIRFKDTEYIRVGTYNKKLKDYPEKERSLWSIFQNYKFEDDTSLQNVSAGKVLELLDYPAYFDLTKQSLPPNRDAILSRLEDEGIISLRRAGVFSITNLGAILFAKDLSRFEQLFRKSLRVIIYKGRNRVETVREQPNNRGYAVGFGGAIGFINSQVPVNEQIEQVFRKELPMYPSIAIRELVANALIHQDFLISGAGPTVEIFSERIEITNPGAPLIDTLRFIDQPPRSRNEKLAAFMRRINICEERGSGIDKVVHSAEIFQLPPPDFRTSGDNTITVLYAHKTLAEMDAKERIRACYQHACLCYVSNDRMTNTSLRKRFAIEDKNYSIASRIIAETIREGLIKPFDPENTSKKHSSYVPFWG